MPNLTAAIIIIVLNLVKLLIFLCLGSVSVHTGAARTNCHFLDISQQGGHFSVPMRAVLPNADITVPGNLFFGLCAVKDSVQVTFEVANNR